MQGKNRVNCRLSATSLDRRRENDDVHTKTQALPLSPARELDVVVFRLSGVRQRGRVRGRERGSELERGRGNSKDRP